MIVPSGRPTMRPRIEVSTGVPPSGRIESGSAWRVPWRRYAFVAEDGHHGPTKPSSGLLQGRKLVLDGLPAITGRPLAYSAARLI